VLGEYLRRGALDDLASLLPGQSLSGWHPAA
jgi:hypothetical protein